MAILIVDIFESGSETPHAGNDMTDHTRHKYEEYESLESIS